MSSKTVIPGLQGQPAPNQTPFSPQSPFGVQGSETVIPGVSLNGVINNETKGQIFGFLFSVSKTMAGEYWPLLLGANTIGRGPANSIKLGEVTVSESHASIHIISRANKLIVYIKDDQSKTGTLLNGELLRGEADLKNGDIITIGEQYELYVILINAFDHGLKQREGFVASAPVAGPAPIPGQQVTAPFPPASQTGRPITTAATIIDGQVGQVPVGGHTVIMGGNKK